MQLTKMDETADEGKEGECVKAKYSRKYALCVWLLRSFVRLMVLVLHSLRQIALTLSGVTCKTHTSGTSFSSKVIIPSRLSG